MPAVDVQDQDILDLLATTLPKMKKENFIDLSQELHDYLIVPYLLTTKGGLKTQTDGVGLETTLMVEHGGRSRWISETTEDSVMIIDHLKKMKVNFCLLTDSLAYFRTEILANKGESRINDVLAPRRRAMYLRIAETMEENFFATPNADDELVPWGLKYWIVKNATTGFNGGYAAGFTRKGNINITEVPQFKNWTDTYVAATKADLITKMRKAHRKTNWKSPRKDKNFEGDSQLSRRIILANENTCEAMENIGEAQNENLGRDLAPYEAGRGSWGLTKTGDGELLFKRNPIVYAEPLDDDTTDPIYGLDMSTFHAMTRAGDNMRLGAFKVAPLQHRAYAAHLDHAHQTICTNPRNNWVISK
jgi:hypothetical protein